MKKQIYFITSLFIIVITSTLRGQGETWNWYFGFNAGINFTSSAGPPVAVTNGATGNTGGNATISDAAGNLLFYTTGQVAFNRLHVPMANGVNLRGNLLGSQPAAIVPKPGNPNIYYIFTSSDVTWTGGIGYHYSEVDMTLSAGNGSVTANKNILLNANSTQKLAVVKHCNGVDYWVITHELNNNNFKAYSVTAAGVNTVPVVSSVGTINAFAGGYLKASPDGKRLAYVSNANFVEVLDFNTSTGVVSNPITISGSTYSGGAYGVEFSPDQSKLYLTRVQFDDIIQINLCAGSNAAIISSAITITTTPFGLNTPRALQLGPDGRIYIAMFSDPWLGVINNPNVLGPGCNYVSNAVSLNGQQSTQGLPNFSSSYFQPTSTPITSLSAIGSTVVCLNSSFTSPTLNTTQCSNTVNAITAYSWNFGDPASGVLNTSSVANPSHIYTANGTYTVNLVLTIPCGTIGLTHTLTTISCGPAVAVNNVTLCSGSCGVLTATASGGAGAYTYNWTPNIGAGPGPHTVCPNSTTVYSVSVTDALNATVSNTATVQVLPTPTLLVTASSTNACQGQSLSLIGASSATNFQWAGPNSYTSSAQSPTLTNLQLNNGGVYTLNVTSANGCTGSVVASVSVNALPTATFSIVNAVCNGTNGILQITNTSAGTQTITSSLLNGSPVATPTITGLASGNYTIALTNNLGCSASFTTSVGNTAGITNFATTFTNATCGGNNGSIVTGAITGGTPTYSFNINNGAYATNTSFLNLATGTYTIGVIDLNGCTFSKTVTINSTGGPTTASIIVTAATCGNSNGSATVSSLTGGVGPYQYSFNGNAFSAATTLANQIAGPKNVVVQDVNGCTFTVNFTIGNTGGPTSTLSTVSNVSCNGGSNGSFTLNTTGGTPAYNYTLLPSNLSNGLGSFSNLASQSYTVNVQDAAGCLATLTVAISQPAVLTLTQSFLPPTCNGGNNATITANASGGTAPYLYSLNTGANQASTVFTGNIPSGTYTLTVTDNNSCTATSSVGVTQPLPISNVSITASSSNLCPGGTLTLSTSAANSYTWSGPNAFGSSLQNPSISNLSTANAGNYTLVITTAAGCTGSVVASVSVNALPTATFSIVNAVCNGTNGILQITNTSAGTQTITSSLLNGSPVATPTITGLASGNYTIALTNNLGCSASFTTSVGNTAGITNFATTFTNATCGGNNGSIVAGAITGGTPTYSFNINNGAYATNTSFFNLATGTYTIGVIDLNGCTFSKTVTINSTGGPTTASIIVTAATCGNSNGSATVSSVTGGVAPYQYSFNGSAFSAATTLANQIAGPKNVVVQDVNGCTFTVNFTISNTGGPTSTLSTVSNVSCNGGSNGSFTLNTTGGTPAYNYTLLPSNVSNGLGSFSNLTSQSYTVNVQDAAGCLATLTVAISQPAALTLTQSFLPPTCNGGNNATITANASGGTAPYLYSLNTGANQASTVFTGNIPSGTYTLTVTDNNSCTATSSVGVTQPNPLLISTISTASILCFGGNNGFINTSVSGGTPIYNYSWVSSSTVTPGNNALATNLTSGGYTLSVTDLQGCSTSTVYNVSQPLPLVVLGSTVNSASCGLANGSATVTIGGGISSQPYNYLWNTLTSQTTNIATGLNGGVWTLTITDGNGCTITESVTITAPPAPTATLGFTPPLCFGQNNASAWITATGTGPFTYSWSPLSLTTGTINGIGAGVYTATVTDFYGCKTNGIVNVTQPNLLILNVSAPDTICYGQNAQINTSASGGTSPYNYYWSSANSVITGTAGGPYSIAPTVNSNYTVSATDANGCIVSPTIIYVKVKPQLIAKGFSVTACDKDLVTLSPVITSSGSGGPYTYNWSNTMMGSSITVPARFSPINPNVYSVTINDGCTVPNTVANFTIDVKPSPTGSFTSNVKSGCAPLLVNFIASSTDAKDKFIWNFYSAGNAIGNEPQQYINYTNAGVYNVGIKITNTFGCKRDTIIPNYIIVYPSPIADFELIPKEVNLFDPSFTFINTSQGASSFFWDFGDYGSNSNTSVVINPKHTYENIGIYDVHLVASNLYGCKDTLKKQVEVKLDVGIYFPNTFTPNGDNLNEEFKPKGYGIKSEPYKLEIFDRWGIELFSSENFSKGWDGTVKGTNIIAEEGIYVYKCFLTDFGGNKKYFVGHVTLLK